MRTQDNVETCSVDFFWLYTVSAAFTYAHYNLNNYTYSDISILHLSMAVFFDHIVLHQFTVSAAPNVPVCVMEICSVNAVMKIILLTSGLPSAAEDHLNGSMILTG